MPFSVEHLLKEASYKATTSGGKGGQNVNKVATRIELYFDVVNSVLLKEEQKELILKKLAGKISDDGILRLTSSEDRTQLKNKEKVKEKFIHLITTALKKPKTRKATKPSRESKEERIKDKKKISEKKSLRSRIE